MTTRWRNIPLPEEYLIALALGTLAHVLVPVPLPLAAGILRVLGAALAALGFALIAWSVRAARDVDVAQPAALITHGPYARSRNPMYLGWTALVLGIALLVGSVWMLIAVAAGWSYLQAVTIPGEEASLRQAFGEAFEAYRRRARRWL
ncbi:MAG: isoprenylcysteine carboxylmethyltransferase family protein [Chloroflexi bacterium]|nr:isoprenylcysteine carboxylmethyltransferase family protein [Chloroflexota bacterium]